MSESIRTTGDHITYDDDHHDRVRWPAIIAGLFGTLSVLAVLTVLGTAIGLSAVDQDSDSRNFAIGAGVWGTITALVAFAFGGWLAARSSDPQARGHGILQGAMVWMVSLALLSYMLGSGIGSLTSRATQGAASNPDITSRITGNTPADPATGAMPSADTSVDRAAAERAAERGAKGAWGTLIAMLLGLAASLAGGYLGARHHDDNGDNRRHHLSGTARPAIS